MALYQRKAHNLSNELFNSVYDDLFSLASRQQARAWEAAKGKRSSYYAGEAQEMLDSFCRGRLSLGCALDFIRANRG